MRKMSLGLTVALLIVFCAGAAMAQALTDQEQLGKLFFF